MSGARRDPISFRYIEAVHKVLQHRCPACDSWFIPARRDQAYCSSACRAAAYRERKRKRKYAESFRSEP